MLRLSQMQKHRSEGEARHHLYLSRILDRLPTSVVAGLVSCKTQLFRRETLWRRTYTRMPGEFNFKDLLICKTDSRDDLNSSE